MKEWRYKLHIENCRAIKSADISLSEITVLSGVNASGKSTIAKIFRDLIESSVGYERLLAEKFWNKFFGEWAYSLNEIARYQGKRRNRRFTQNFLSPIVRDMLAHGKMSLKDAADSLERELEELIEGATSSSAIANGDFFASLKRRLNLNVDDGKLVEIFHEKKNDVLRLFDSYVAKPTFECYKGLPLYDAIYEGTVVLKEGGSLIFSNEEGTSLSQHESGHGHFDEIKMIRRAVYIESPFKSMPTSSLDEELEMGDSFTRLKNESHFSADDKADDGLFSVLAGMVEYEKEDDAYSSLLGERGRWLYHRNDDRIFDLKECATGIRSFSILNALFSKGWLDSGTLLIIDEPEAHLHPQWIVEYARVLLLLSVKFRVRLLLTSHSPDMINAIHTIGTAMGLSDVMNFYLAEKDAVDPYMFNYKSLGCTVGEIFKAYNVSFKVINDYAKDGTGM